MQCFILSTSKPQQYIPPSFGIPRKCSPNIVPSYGKGVEVSPISPWLEKISVPILAKSIRLFIQTNLNNLHGIICSQFSSPTPITSHYIYNSYTYTPPIICISTFQHHTQEFFQSLQSPIPYYIKDIHS